MKSKKLRYIASVAVLVLTVLVFIRFFQGHPQYLHHIAHINRWTIVLLLVLYAISIILLIVIYDVCMQLCGLALPYTEKILLTSYSSIVNFFGPLQSGPGVRAVYLKARHGIRLRDYTLVSLLYYGMFAFVSVLFLLIGTRPWWQTGLALLLVAISSVFVIRLFMRRDRPGSQSRLQLKGQLLAMLLFVTSLQVLLMAVIYFVELRAVNPHISWGQAVSYTGAANFALFVSLTPGAIGFRETFLVFSEHLHHVSTGNIFSANLIDRGVYVLFLGLLFLVVLSLHGKTKLQLTKLRRSAAAASEQ